MSPVSRSPNPPQSFWHSGIRQAGARQLLTSFHLRKVHLCGFIRGGSQPKLFQALAGDFSILTWQPEKVAFKASLELRRDEGLEVGFDDFHCIHPLSTIHVKGMRAALEDPSVSNSLKSSNPLIHMLQRDRLLSGGLQLENLQLPLRTLLGNLLRSFVPELPSSECFQAQGRVIFCC